MERRRRHHLLLVLLLAAGPVVPRAASASPPTAGQAARHYRWHRRATSYEPLSSRIRSPAGCARVPLARGSYGWWLRHLPLLPRGSAVHSFAGKLILPASSPHLAAVVDLDVGRRDRQQCMDTIMRLRGEYLYQRGQPQRIRFAWAGGLRFGFPQWRRGLRPRRQGRRWIVAAGGRPSTGYGSFRRYMGYMFSWTGSQHQAAETRVRLEAARAGDFFLQPGSPGHAAVLLDLCRDATGQRRALVGQGFMPAQDLHLLRGGHGSPWFRLDPSAAGLETPLWQRFRWNELKRFRN